MDFQSYSPGVALVFHEVFFPESPTAMVLILVMGTYGAGYVMCIVGAFIFGKISDRIGRKKVLFITITMMGICTTLVGVLPTYAQIGVFAPTLLVTLRIIQGLGVGVEIPGAGTMLVKYAPKSERGIISSFVAMGASCGTLSATAIQALMFFILSKEELLARGWRIPLLASVVVMVFAIWLRTNLKESPVFEKVNDSNQPTVKPAPAGSTFQSRSFWLTAGLCLGQVSNSGLIQALLAGYLVWTLLFNKTIPTNVSMISSILGFMIILFLGWLSDRVGRRIPYTIMNTSMIASAQPMLSIIVDKSYAPDTIMVALIMICDCAVLGLFTLEDITMAEMLSCKDRLTRTAISKEIGDLIASGFSPVLTGIFCAMTRPWYSITIMVMAYSMIGLISALKMPEVKDRDLGAPGDAAEDQSYVVRAVQPFRSL